MSQRRRLTYNDYKVGWICALSTELTAAEAMLDEKHEPLDRIRRDNNHYILGCIGKHNVVLACLPTGLYGNVSASTVATRMLATFQSVEFGLMVGIGGGAPSKKYPIHLGDVVVSKPCQQHSGVVAFDHGKLIESGILRRTGSLNRPPQIVMTALPSLRTKLSYDPGLLDKGLTMSQFPDKDHEDPHSLDYKYQGQEHDLLFKAEYAHVRDDSGEDRQPCAKCSGAELEDRQRRSTLHPRVFYGTIASSDKVMKDAATRDRLRDELGAICFEMEAAGLMNDFPCLVIRGICDYSDSHKKSCRRWQGYAAATAAVYAKELLLVMEPVKG
jgi:nucleoside phosphorylase